MRDYQIALLSTNFDATYQNVLRFDTRAAQEGFFNVAALFQDAAHCNFNANSLLDTIVTYQMPSDVDLNTLLSQNYAIVKDNSDNAALKYYYFFVTEAKQDSGNQIRVRLRLDWFQTYYIDLQFTPCNIRKAHLNRWVEVDAETIAFDGTPTSKLFASEELKNFPKRLKTRKTYSLMPDRFGGGALVTEITENNLKFCDEYLTGWIYVYLNASALKLEFTGSGFPSDARRMNENVNGGIFTMPYVTLAFPILKDDASISVDLKDGYIRSWNFREFLNIVLSQIESYILDVRISQTPPFPNFNFFDDYFINQADIENGTLKIEKKGSTSRYEYGEFFVLGKSSNSSGTLGYMVYNREVGIEYSWYDLNSGMGSRTIDTGLEYTFKKSDLIGKPKNKKFNPKLLSQAFTEIRLGQGIGTPFIYDAQKANNKEMLMLWRESIVPGITRAYLALINKSKYLDEEKNEKSIYNENTFKSLVGCSFSQDTSFPFAINQLEQYLANNKNFYQQNEINRQASFAKGMFSGALGIGGGIASGNPLAILAGGVSMIGSSIDLARDKVQEGLTVDNMRNAPETYQNLNGNPLLPMGINDNRTYIEIWQALDSELEIANDYMCMFGFTYNRIGKIKDFDNIRKIYNFIQADVEEMAGVAISNAIHDEIKRCFARGIRMWNVPDFNYDNENYERWLEDATGAIG